MALFPPSRRRFYEELAKLTGAGFGIREAMAVVRQHRHPRELVALMDDIDRGLEAGLPIHQAFASGGRCGGLELAMIRAGERGGSLPRLLAQLAEHLALVEDARKQALMALIYPAFLLHLGVIAAVLPPALMRRSAGFEILTDLIVAFALTYLGLAVVFLLLRGLVRRAADSSAIDRGLNVFPLLGSARRNLAMSRFTRAYHACLLAGVSVVETLETAARASGSGALRESGLRLAREAGDGHPLGPRFLRSKDFPPAFSQSYASAELAGALDHDLERWSRVFGQDAALSTRALASGLPKVLYILILLFVAWQIVSFYSGYLQMLGA